MIKRLDPRNSERTRRSQKITDQSVVAILVIHLIMSPPPARKVVVVGAGPVGCLAAMAFAKQGWSVDLYEGRSGLTPLLMPCRCLLTLAKIYGFPHRKLPINRNL